MPALVLRNVRPFGGEPSDLAIGDGRIINAGQTPADARALDCTGLIALTGLVDLHAHLREPGRPDTETVESGTSAVWRRPLLSGSSSTRTRSCSWPGVRAVRRAQGVSGRDP